MAGRDGIRTVSGQLSDQPFRRHIAILPSVVTPDGCRVRRLSPYVGALGRAAARRMVTAGWDGNGRVSHRSTNKHAVVSQLVTPGTFDYSPPDGDILRADCHDDYLPSDWVKLIDSTAPRRIRRRYNN